MFRDKGYLYLCLEQASEVLSSLCPGLHRIEVHVFPRVRTSKFSKGSMQFIFSTVTH